MTDRPRRSFTFSGESRRQDALRHPVLAVQRTHKREATAHLTASDFVPAYRGVVAQELRETGTTWLNCVLGMQAAKRRGRRGGERPWVYDVRLATVGKVPHSLFDVESAAPRFACLHGRDERFFGYLVEVAPSVSAADELGVRF